MHNFKKLVSPVILMIIIICVNEMLCFAAKPYSFFRFDMHNLENGEEYTDIFVGTSHGKAAIAPEVVDQYTGGNSINMCLGGEYLSDSYFIVKEAIRNEWFMNWIQVIGWQKKARVQNIEKCMMSFQNHW